jgi:DegV family protein with EDD domain
MNTAGHSSSGEPQARPATSGLLTLDNTAIVVDSTCDPADGWLEQPGIYMVPLKVHFGDQMFRDGVDMTYKEFFAKLEQSEVLPTTSQPTAGEFVAAYEEALKHYEHVFSLHISGEMSGTVRAAEQAAEQFDHVYVYDMRTVTSALSLGAERLRARLATGCTLEEAHAYVRHFRDHSQLLVHAATLEYLRRGGRIGLAASFVGGVFDIKPLIAAVDGTLTGYAKVRGLKKAMAAMQRFVEEHSKPDDELYFCVIDAVNDEEPPLIREMIERVRPNAHYTFQGHVAAVVGTHIGPGTAAFAMIVE